MEKFDIILQGPVYEYTHDIAEQYEKLDFVDNVFISTWKYDGYFYYPHHPKIKYLFFNKPEYHGVRNRNYQIVGSYKSLLKVNNEFCVRGRSDILYDDASMWNMYNFYNEYKERVLTYENDPSMPYNRICVPGIYKYYAFHPRDQFFWGNTKDLIEVFDIPLDEDRDLDGTENNNILLRSECFIASKYYAKFDSKINKYIENPLDYLTDSAKYRDEVLECYHKLMTKVFKPFPQKDIDFYWIKYGQRKYNFAYERMMGQIWHEDDVYS